MDEIVVQLRRETAVRALVPLFFVSGATGLIYQTIWGRQLHLVFGTSTFAIATVLSAFMAGLALGGFMMARYADRLLRPLVVYGWLEVAIGLYALLFPYIVRWIEPVYLAIWQAWEPSPLVFGGIQFVLVGSALVLPTAWMGATLPLLARFATDSMGAAGDRVALLYSVNTAGAVFGTWLAGFMLLPALGLWATTGFAATCNLLLGAAAIAVASWAHGSDEPDLQAALADLGELDEPVPDAPRAPATTDVIGVAMAVACIAGFSALVYEVAWFRLLGLMLGASTYAFSVMLLAFLVGIAIGGRVGGPIADADLAAGGLDAVLRRLAAVQVGVGSLSFAMMYAFNELPFWYVWLFDVLRAAESPVLVWAVSLLLSALVMTPPAVLMGVAFPLAVRAAIGRADALGEAVGRVYGANTFGGLVGAALAGFVLLPWLHVSGTILAAVVCNLVAGAVAFGGASAASRRSRSRQAWAMLGVAVLTLVLTAAWRPRWDPMLMTAGMYKYVTSFDDHSREGIRDYAVDQYELLFYEEGLSSVVTVARNVDSGNIWLANNGKVDASTTVDMPTQVLVSLLPLQYAESVDDVLVIGLASGITAGALTQVDDIQRLDIVELEPAIRRAAAFFTEYNHGVLEDPRTTLVDNDGRNQLLLTPPGTYDVIVSEPSNPWLTGVSNLFTEDFFRMGKTRLKEGGVWAQWVQLYGMDDNDLRSLVGTFADVYPHVLLFAAAEDADLVLIGAEHELAPTLENARRLYRWEGVAAELRTVGLATPTDLLASFVTDREGMLKMAGRTTRNTDDNMRIEYAAPLNLHRDTQAMNIPVLYEHARVPFKEFGDDPLALSDLARAYRKRSDDDRAILAMIQAIQLLPGDDPLREELRLEAAGWYTEEIEEEEG